MSIPQIQLYNAGETILLRPELCKCGSEKALCENNIIGIVIQCTDCGRIKTIVAGLKQRRKENDTIPRCQFAKI